MSDAYGRSEIPIVVPKDRRHVGPTVVAVIVVVGFLAALTLLIIKPINLEEKAATLLNVLLGTLAAQFSAVVQYFMGSSSGSREKDELTRKLLQK